jgi:GGDEF domain-containing protein
VLDIERALSNCEVLAASPVAAATARARAWAGSPVPTAELVGAWKARQPGSSAGSTRYRWDLSHYRCKPPSFAGPASDWHAWRPAEEEEVRRDPHKFEQRFLLPLSIAESCEFLAEIASSADETGRDAQALLFESEPVFRRDFGSHALVTHAFFDTFAAFALVQTPRAMDRLHPGLFALCSAYAEEARRTEGILLGSRFPFHGKPQVSASAQLAAGLVRLGMDLSLLARIVEFVAESQRASGAWGDGNGPDDVLTTFVAFELVARLDPAFDARRAATALARFQRSDGLFSALGPEAAWLTKGVASLLAVASESFASRFRWPHVPTLARDRKTGLPFYAYFDDLARLFAELGGLGASEVELAFLDLAGFRAFNNRFGQDMGDEVLAEFAGALGTLGASRAVRDGGDEFLIVGTPTHAGLEADLRALCRAWPERFLRRFGSDAPPVAARVLVGSAPGRELGLLRERLGRSLGELKLRKKDVPNEGVVERLR